MLHTPFGQIAAEEGFVEEDEDQEMDFEDDDDEEVKVEESANKP